MKREDYIKQTNYTWPSLENDVRTLAEKISADYQPEAIVVLAMGGWIPGRLLKNFIKADYYSLGCRNYDDNDNTFGQVVFYQNVDEDKIAGKRILILDEVCDTGVTMTNVVERIKTAKPAEIRTAVIHHKGIGQFVPDYIVRTTDKDEWITYPWDLS